MESLSGRTSLQLYSLTDKNKARGAYLKVGKTLLVLCKTSHNSPTNDECKTVSKKLDCTKENPIFMAHKGFGVSLKIS